MALTSGERGVLVGRLNSRVATAPEVGGRKQVQPQVNEPLTGKGVVLYGSWIMQVGVGQDKEVKFLTHYDPNDNVLETYVQGNQTNADEFGFIRGWSKAEEISPGVYRPEP